jgi:ATP-dependent helicase HrpB
MRFPVSMISLPIDPLLPEIRRLLQVHNRLVIQAAPGAGKTTRVPPALLDTDWLGGQRILLLEPRRLATRAAARRMAAERGETVGETIGYRTRLDTKVGPRTRIEVVTEGILTRMLQQDPALEGVGALLFDEFHERSLQADLGLALSLESQAALREDLRLLVMSATLEGIPLEDYLDAPVLRSTGRSYPVSVYYQACGEAADRTPITQVVRTVLRALEEQEGDILVFLPGTGEIRRVLEGLDQARPDPSILLCPLYGDLEAAAQDAAIQPAPAGRRKLVLATAIAETSLTIEGVRVVVDAGRARVARFDPASGMTRLVTQRVSKAAATQRCGRAGRTAPGSCYRLWDEGTQAGLLAQTPAEILAADLAPLALELARWGTRDPASLRWLDAPPAGAYARAVTLLQALQALDAEGGITPHGRRMAELPLHPRLAHMVLRGHELALGGLACELAALLSERDILRGRERDLDLQHRVELLRQAGRDGSLDRAARQRVLQVATQLRRGLGIKAQDDPAGNTGLLVALAYPDRIARARDDQPGRYRLSGGQGAFTDPGDALGDAEYLAIAALDGDRREARIFLAARLAREDLERVFADQVHVVEQVRWDAVAMRVTARRQLRLGALVLEDAPVARPDPAAQARALLEGVRQQGLAALPWSEAARQLQARLAFLRDVDEAGDWPDLSDATLEATLEDWLLPWLQGLHRWDQVQRLDLAALLENRLDWNRRQRLEDWAPTHISVPSGSRLRVDYAAGGIPVLAVRLQEMFGCADTPRIAGGRVPVLLHLLSPARRPVQVTRDLASFWDKAYAEVKKDLKGRYPKHSWPDDPRQAEARRGVRPRG